eukprot:TRINITY_DN64454_c0_g1_i1.p1 TRINITY_DN64454_c0_g1~~TRINITY_DN64454_c0_g1_i1.p1  ORF type:complete len:200 (-),score=-4.47 TRINITY_DN64454_c0_g1_i1:578-1177(-)
MREREDEKVHNQKNQTQNKCSKNKLIKNFELMRVQIIGNQLYISQFVTLFIQYQGSQQISIARIPQKNWQVDFQQNVIDFPLQYQNSYYFIILTRFQGNCRQIFNRMLMILLFQTKIVNLIICSQILRKLSFEVNCVQERFKRDLFGKFQQLQQFDFSQKEKQLLFVIYRQVEANYLKQIFKSETYLIMFCKPGIIGFQ